MRNQHYCPCSRARQRVGVVIFSSLQCYTSQLASSPQLSATGAPALCSACTIRTVMSITESAGFTTHTSRPRHRPWGRPGRRCHQTAVVSVGISAAAHVGARPTGHRSRRAGPAVAAQFSLSRSCASGRALRPPRSAGAHRAIAGRK